MAKENLPEQPKTIRLWTWERVFAAEFQSIARTRLKRTVSLDCNEQRRACPLSLVGIPTPLVLNRIRAWKFPPRHFHLLGMSSRFRRRKSASRTLTIMDWMLPSIFLYQRI